MSDEEGASRTLAGLGLEAPLAQLANPTIDEWAVRRMWQGIQRQRAAGPGGAVRRRLVLLSAFATLAISGAVFVGASELLRTAEPDTTRRATGPLLTREARPFVSLEGPSLARTPAPTPAARVDFADGSSIEAAPGARVDALASSSDEFVVLLRRGRARFRVTPGGPRLWRVEARDARVEVVGTVFAVESDETGTSVQVDVGRVLVRSPELPEGVQTVVAGQSMHLNGPTPPAIEAPATATLAPTPPPPARAVLRPAERSLVPAAELWAGVDEARRRGQSLRAAALLEQLLRDYPADSQVALAAFTLGVLQLERLERPAEAARSFERAIEFGLGAALREDVYLRWAEALGRAGAGARIATVLAEYSRLYPRGRHRAAIQALLTDGRAP